MGCEVDEVAAIVDAFDTNAGRWNAGRIDLIDLGLDTLDRWQTLLPASHQDNSLDNVVFFVSPGNSEAGLVSDDNLCNVAEKYRRAICRRQHGIANVRHRANKPDAAHDGRLLADIDGIAAYIDVAVIQSLQNLWQRKAIGNELFAVDLDIKCLGLATPTGDVNDARHGAKPAGYYPILKSFQVHHAVARRSDQLVRRDSARRAPRRDGRLCLVLHWRQLAQPVQDLLLRLLIGEVIGELQLHIGKAEKRDSAHCIEVWSGSHANLDRDGDVALDLFRRLPRILRDDGDERRHRVREGLDIQLEKSDEAADHDQGKQGHHERTQSQRKGNDCVHEPDAPRARLQFKQLSAYGSMTLNRRKNR